MLAMTRAAASAAAARVGASAACSVGCLSTRRSARRQSQSSCRRALSVWVVAGEPSGDEIGARLLTALAAEAERRGHPITSVGGVGGPAMAAAGLERPLFPMEELSVMGVWELLPHLPRLRRRLHEAAEAVYAASPDVLITIDSKGFSFRLVDLVRRHHQHQHQQRRLRQPPVCAHYVSPSWWAYRGGEARLKGLKAMGIDLVLCLLPFEPSALRAAGIGAEFVGHPVVEDLAEAEAGVDTGGEFVYRRHDLCGQRVPVGSGDCRGDTGDDGDSGGERRDTGERGGGGGPVLALLPGSREQELRRHLPLMREMSAILAARDGADESISAHVTAPAGTRVVLVALPQHVRRLALEASSWPLPATVVPSSPPAARAAAFAVGPRESTAIRVTHFDETRRLKAPPRFQPLNLRHEAREPGF